MTSGGIHIRPACLDDVETIVQYNSAMALETEHRRLDLSTLRLGTLAFLENPEYGFYLVAELPEVSGHKPVGQLMITYEWSDWRNGLFWWIQSVYVAPDRRGLGVFRALHEHVVTRAKADPRVCGMRLYVEQQNHRAQSVYQRVGLLPSVYAVYEQDFVLGLPSVTAMNKELP
ncbi:MAG: GNAT family N-acetyltransferase [Nitrospira sp.]